ncbi:MAG: aminomethyl transferase family protein [Gemmatimonadaceae bacterium]|nr:aminomethyl transferase family protein [Gemmatimonadaceae bacterium]
MTTDTTPVQAEPTPLLAPTPLTSDEARAYATLRTDAVWWEAAINWIAFRGPKAADALNGLVTNDVAALQPGEGCYAAALSPKGKMVTDMVIVRLEHDVFLMTVLARTAPAWLALARKYVNPRLCTVTDETERYATWLAYGSSTARVIATLGGADATAENLTDGMVSALTDWQTWRHAPWNVGRVTVRLIRAPLMGELPGFMILADVADQQAVQQRFDSAPLFKGTYGLWNVTRIEAGRPLMGVDMDENTIPQEANLDSLGAISFDKGCYTGQETVARLHFRGHVNKQLRGLLSDTPMPIGAEIHDANGKLVGRITSSAISPTRGPVALGMIRREVAPGDAVTVLTPEPVTASVAVLPLVGFE